jgi:hypothetical protein
VSVSSSGKEDLMLVYSFVLLFARSRSFLRRCAFFLAMLVALSGLECLGRVVGWGSVDRE